MSASHRPTENIATKGIDVVYRAPEIVSQRLMTLDALNVRLGEVVGDVGCGNGLLTDLLAQCVGEKGRVVAVDQDATMLERAASTCSERDQIEWRLGGAESLPIADGTLDALACCQVLLYVPRVEQALGEMYRSLKAGGRVAIIETDWCGAVMNSEHPDIIRRIFEGWNSAVASPRLPVRLGPMLEEAGFAAVKVEAIPIINRDLNSSNFSSSSIEDFAELAKGQGRITQEEFEEILREQHLLGAEGRYFFCVNRFLFTALKSA